MLPPEVLARIDALVDDAPPLSPGQERIIRRTLAPSAQAQDPAA
jgi:hypothetical protein